MEEEVRRKRVLVVGAGAIGGLLGVKLAQLDDVEVTLVARGAHLEAIRQQGGLLLESPDKKQQWKATLSPDRVRATDRLLGDDEAGSSASYDVIFLGVKAHQVEPIVEELQQLLQRNPHCILVTLQNGIPWWYFQNLPPSSPQTTKSEEGDKEGEGGGTSASNDLNKNQDYFIRAVDPTGIISRTINPKQVIGCVVYPAAEMEQPGLIHHVEGDRFPVGELDHGTTSERVRALSSLLERAGFKAPVLEDIRAELWLKLWGSVCFNPVSALCHATLEELCQYPLTRQLAVAMMEEVQNIAQRLGARMRVPLERRIAGAERVGKHKTSTLQDVEAGRQPEIDAVIGSVVELGRLTGVATPHVNSVYACIKLLAKMMEDHRACVPLKSLAGQ